MSEMDLFKPTVGEYKGMVGIMVGRVCDPSNDDIKLRFEDGECRWFRFREVREERSPSANDENAVKDLPKAFERKDNGWHIEVYRRPNGLARINRISGVGCEPLCWDSPDRTPEDWVAIQVDSHMYHEFTTNNSPALSL